MLAATSVEARSLTFEERVAAQRAIEQVYWNHRIWPKENPGPKPPLSAVLPNTAIRARVEDTLAKSNALEKYWHRPITAEQLQAEMNRMPAHTHDPRVLQELFVALGNDPSLIAETLARQALVDRLIRNWHASNGVDDDCDGTIDDASPPGPATTLIMSSDTSLEWTALAAAQTYDLVLGDLGLLHSSGGNFTAATLGYVANDAASTSASFNASPGAGGGYWVLMRGGNCAGSGTYDSGDPAQVGSRDTEVDASPLSCAQFACGDSVCNGTESCSTCPADCGACACAVDAECGAATLRAASRSGSRNPCSCGGNTVEEGYGIVRVSGLPTLLDIILSYQPPSTLVVPQGATGEAKFLDRLHQLPGFSNKAMIEAMTSVVIGGSYVGRERVAPNPPRQTGHANDDFARHNASA